MLNRMAFASLSLLGLLAMGCSKETTSSSNIKTGGIAALIDVYADSDTTATVHVKLVVGGSDSNTYVTLEGKDALSATADKTTKTLEQVDPGIYEAKFSDVGEDSKFSVLFDRPDDVTASDNTGTLPAPYTIDAPTPDLSRMTDDLPISWSPESSDSMEATFDGSCIFIYDKDLSDTGMYTVPAGGLDSTGDPSSKTNPPETCDIKLSMDRKRDGSADAKFDRESWFRLHQRRSVKFTSNP
jgi:hypothetical protein